jgi:hypothetical protein
LTNLIKNLSGGTMEDLIKAMQIFFKYTQTRNPTHCEHDVMQVDVRPDDVTDADKEELSKLGFHVDLDEDDFRSYRFGSC